jgi:ComF family protein
MWLNPPARVERIHGRPAWELPLSWLNLSMNDPTGRALRNVWSTAWRSWRSTPAAAALADGLTEALGGSLCAVCRRWQGLAICGDCLARFGTARLRCARCAIALTAGVAPAAPESGRPAGSRAVLCGACVLDPPPQVAAVAAFDYVFPWSGLLGRFKFHGAVDLAGPLARALAAAVEQAPGLPAVDLVLPVPLAVERLRERGYNQAWELARRVARRRGLRADATLIERVRNTAHQLALPRAERAANVHAAFVLGPRGQAQVAGRRVALVDDVMTTGATLAEIAKVLQRGGAADVQCWVVARTPLDGEIGAARPPLR